MISDVQESLLVFIFLAEIAKEVNSKNYSDESVDVLNLRCQHRIEGHKEHRVKD